MMRSTTGVLGVIGSPSEGEAVFVGVIKTSARVPLPSRESFGGVSTSEATSEASALRSIFFVSAMSYYATGISRLWDGREGEGRRIGYSNNPIQYNVDRLNELSKHALPIILFLGGAGSGLESGQPRRPTPTSIPGLLSLPIHLPIRRMPGRDPGLLILPLLGRACASMR